MKEALEFFGVAITILFVFGAILYAVGYAVDNAYNTMIDDVSNSVIEKLNDKG